jgi:hypothetical protein
MAEYMGLQRLIAFLDETRKTASTANDIKWIESFTAKLRKRLTFCRSKLPELDIGLSGFNEPR